MPLRFGQEIQALPRRSRLSVTRGAWKRRLKRFARAVDQLRRENSAGAVMRYAVAATLRRAEPVVLRVRGHDLTLRPDTPDLDVALATLGDEFRTLAHAYPRDVEGLIVDAGGFIGTAALAFAAMYPRARVVTIEPSAANLRALERNVAAAPTIHVERAALVGRSRGPAPLYDVGAGVWGHTLDADRPGPTRAPIGETPTTTLQDIMAKYGAERILILKLDIEGVERELLADPWWLDKTGAVAAELHESVAPGVEAAFARANAGRYVYKDGGEKWFSVGRALLERP